MRRIVVTCMVLAIALLAARTGFAEVSCTRDGLQQAVDLYLAAQAKGLRVNHDKIAEIESKETALKAALFEMRDAIDRYYADHKRYPKGLGSLATAKYLTRVPIDPFTASARSWSAIQARPDRRYPLATGIYDVKSGSTATALDGTKYSDW